MLHLDIYCLTRLLGGKSITTSTRTVSCRGGLQLPRAESTRPLRRRWGSPQTQWRSVAMRLQCRPSPTSHQSRGNRCLVVLGNSVDRCWRSGHGKGRGVLYMHTQCTPNHLADGPKPHADNPVPPFSAFRQNLVLLLPALPAHLCCRVPPAHRSCMPLRSVQAEKMVDAIYQDFLGKVAAGRRLSPEATRAAARGRVWTGPLQSTDICNPEPYILMLPLLRNHRAVCHQLAAAHVRLGLGSAGAPAYRSPPGRAPPSHTCATAHSCPSQLAQQKDRHLQGASHVSAEVAPQAEATQVSITTWADAAGTCTSRSSAAACTSLSFTLIGFLTCVGRCRRAALGAGGRAGRPA